MNESDPAGPVSGSQERAWVGRAYERHRSRVFAFLFRRTRDRERAEDLTQEVFLSAVQGLPDLDATDGSVLAWLYCVAQRRWIDDLRRSESHWGRQVPLECARELAELDKERVVARLLESLDELPAGYREIIAMKLFEGRSYAEIASGLGISEAAAKMRLVRALEQLQGLLREKGVDP